MRVERHAEAFLDDFAGVGFPVVFRIGDEVGVVVADGAVHLGVNGSIHVCFKCKDEFQQIAEEMEGVQIG